MSRKVSRWLGIVDKGFKEDTTIVDASEEDVQTTKVTIIAGRLAYFKQVVNYNKDEK